MKFIDVVVRAIALSRKINAEEEEIRQRLGLTDGISLDDRGREYMKAPRPAADELAQFLHTLSDAHVLRLQTLMYAGRDRDANLTKLHKELSCTREDAIRTICEKAPLDEYLADGLVLAQRRFLDLDGEW
jgi:hypothetical protein